MDPELLVLPGLIFLARIADTSIGTVRIVLLVAGRRLVPRAARLCRGLDLGARHRGVVSNLDNPLTVIGFAGGFAVGIKLGLWSRGAHRARLPRPPGHQPRSRNRCLPRGSASTTTA